MWTRMIRLGGLGEQGMNKLGLLMALFFCIGCVSVQIPQYLQDKHPYKKEYFADYEKTLDAVKTVLKNSDWIIASTSDPSVFEATSQNKSSDGKKILLLTENKQTSMLLFSRYTQLNIYIRALKNSTEVEIRYEAITPLPFKQFRSYRNDSFIKKLFSGIQAQLEKK